MLTLTLPSGVEYYDDKADVLEQAGLGTAAQFELRAGQPPPVELMAFMRLLNLDGACVSCSSLFSFCF